MTPHVLRIHGRYRVPHPLTLHQLSAWLGCSSEEVHTLMAARRFPHAYRDRDGQWRVPMADAAAYVRWSQRERREAGTLELPAVAVH
ncbi:MAG TPA: hypothetical protein VH116_04845 [Gemmatimonadales bacterium]|nr:hypothetical protein [Gemmatimonadales bacterium]